MNNDTIKIQQIKGHMMLINDVQELIYKYDELANKDKITEITHETIDEQLTIFKNALINYIELIVNK